MEDIKPHGKTCGNDALEEVNRMGNQVDEVIAGKQLSEEKMDCKIIELAEASDLFMYNSNNGNTTTITNQINAITNIVDGLYNQTYFTDDIQFSIVTLIIAVDAATDPWTTSTNSGTLLDDFRSWGNSNGFNLNNSGNFDIGQLWTTRSLDGGGTLGVAWVDGVCTTLRYNLCDKFSNNTLTAVVSAHEIGHNLDCPHDASGAPHIMAPAVQSTSTWSTLSQGRVDATMATKTCFTDCNSGPTCYNNLNHNSGLSTNETGVADYESSTYINTTANTNIASGAQVDYDATTNITLNGDFTVNQGAIFNAFIDGCNAGAGGVNLNADNPDALQQIDTESIEDNSIELKATPDGLGKHYIKALKDKAIKQIEGLK